MSVCRKHLIPLHIRMFSQQASANFYQVSDDSSSETDDQISDSQHQRFVWKYSPFETRLYLNTSKKFGKPSPIYWEQTKLHGVS